MCCGLLFGTKVKQPGVVGARMVGLALSELYGQAG